MKLSKIIYIIISGAFFYACDYIPDINREEDALRSMYKETNGAVWYDRTNWFGYRPVSEWYGISTDKDGNVTEINLPNNNLQWYFSLDLDRFYKLSKIDISGNKISDINVSGGANILEELVMNDLNIDRSSVPWGGNLSGIENLYANHSVLKNHSFSEIGKLDFTSCDISGDFNSIQEMSISGSDIAYSSFYSVEVINIENSSLFNCRFSGIDTIEISDSTIQSEEKEICFSECSQIILKNVEFLIEGERFFCVYACFSGGDQLALYLLPTK